MSESELTCILDPGYTWGCDRGCGAVTSAAESQVLVMALLVYAIAATLRVGAFSLAPVGFAAAGSYSVAILLTKTSLSFAAATLLTVAGCLVSAVLLELPLIRLSGIYAALASLAFLIMLQGLIETLSITGGSLGILDIPEADCRYALLIVLLINGLVWYVTDHCHIGRQLDTIAHNSVLAEAMGLPVRGIRLLASTYTACLAALAGALYAHSFYSISPSVFSFPFAIQISALAVIAGGGYWLAPAVSSFSIGLLPIVFTQLDNWGLIFQGLLMIAVVTLYPDGLSGLARRFTLPARAWFVCSQERSLRHRLLAWF